MLARWAASGGAERGNAQSFLLEFADVLDVPRPRPTTGDPAADAYVFARPLSFQDGRGRRLRRGRRRTSFGRASPARARKTCDDVLAALRLIRAEAGALAV